jgi:hypothetical protein
VYFSPDGNRQLKTAWTKEGSDDAFLALDRNGNGLIDSGLELFGDLTAQPPSQERNGFLALAEFDKVENGGNGDGFISEADLAYSSLLLWTDSNHNGVSESSELQLLSASSLKSISLSYGESRRRDVHGNEFRYFARVRDGKPKVAGLFAWDVFFSTQLKQSPRSASNQQVVTDSDLQCLQ